MELSELLSKISTDLIADTTAQIDGDSELLMSGLIDSLGIMNLVAWVEERLGVEIDPGDVIIENFETPAAIMAFASTLSAEQPA